MQKKSILVIFFTLIQSISYSIAMQVKTCKLGRIVGQQPAMICELNNEFTQPLIKAEWHDSRLLLYGPIGNKKDRIAEEFARVDQAEFHFYSGANIITRLQGSGPSNIHEIFENAKNSDFPTVICIDNIDAFVQPYSDDSHDPYYLAMVQLCVELDAVKNKPHIFVICTAHNIDKIPYKLLSRFGFNQCHIINPAIESRLSIISSLLKNNEQIQYSSEIINYLAEETYDFSVTNIEDLCYLITERSIKFTRKDVDVMVEQFCKDHQIKNRKTFFQKNAKKIAALMVSIGLTSYAIINWYNNYKSTQPKKKNLNKKLAYKKT